jgi:hypothetical protein
MRRTAALALIVLALLVTVGVLVLQAQTAHEGPRWEYSIAHFSFSTNPNTPNRCELAQFVGGEYVTWQLETNPSTLGADCQFALLNQVGAEGWELISVRKEANGVAPLLEYLLKRPLS